MARAESKLKPARIPEGYERAAELAASYFEARRALAERADRIREIKRKAGSRLMPGLRRRIEAAKAARIELAAEIEASPDLWEKPRTRRLHGVKVGRRSLPGRLVIDEPTAVLAIRQLLPGRERDLVAVRMSLVKAAVKKLDGAELAAIGGRIEDLGDETVIAIPKDDVDAIVGALLGDLDEDREEES